MIIPNIRKTKKKHVPNHQPEYACTARLHLLMCRRLHKYKFNWHISTCKGVNLQRFNKKGAWGWLNGSQLSNSCPKHRWSETSPRYPSLWKILLMYGWQVDKTYTQRQTDVVWALKNTWLVATHPCDDCMPPPAPNSREVLWPRDLRHWLLLLQPFVGATG